MTNTIPDNIYLHCFSKIEKLGPSSLKRIYDHFECGESAFMAPIEKFRQLGLSDIQIEAISEMRHTTDPSTELTKLEAEDIKMISLRETGYSALLGKITLPPVLLYYIGAVELLAGKYSLAVVGTRKITSYGQVACQSILPGLIQKGLTIVSGLALGIDALAHELTLANNGKTIAVLGSGLAKREIYPAHNRRLADRILDGGGLILSEYAPGSDSLPFHFPVRNRIISGLSLGTLVIEANEKSGSLITAQSALDQNREVFAVPGPIYSETSCGTNRLIQQGAKLVTSADDILNELELGQSPISQPPKQTRMYSPLEEIVLRLLTEPRNIDDLVVASKYPVSSLSSVLITLEMQGVIRNLGNNTYIKV